MSPKPRPTLSQQLTERGITVVEASQRIQGAGLLPNGLYFTVPADVLENVFQQRSPDDELDRRVRQDKEWSEAIKLKDNQVGVWNGRILHYPYLTPRTPLTLDHASAQVLGKSLAEVENIARIYEVRFRTIDEPLRGYLGWLLSHAPFLDEHDQLLAKHGSEIQKHGFPSPVYASAPKKPKPPTTRVKSRESQWMLEFRDFFKRWRLQTLAAPYLPIPLVPQLPDLRYSSATDAEHGQLQVSFYDIYPIPGQGVVVETMEDILRPLHQADHLAEWKDVIRKSNTAKNVFHRYQRRFQLQHFWRVLHSRYSADLHRKKQKLMSAFADYFGVSIDSIKTDVRRLEKCLGEKWASRNQKLG